jgi:hypothetical protein
MNSNGIKLIQNFAKFGQTDQKLKVGSTHKQHGGSISLFSLRKER